MYKLLALDLGGTLLIIKDSICWTNNLRRVMAHVVELLL
jgi:hypothetical protein